MAPRKRTYDRGKHIRAMARKRVGAVKSSRAIPEKILRKKPKYKKDILDEE
jgi:hypothetical protein